MAEKFKKQLSKLSKRGPHHVLIGDLSYAGLPGKVYTPARVMGVAAIAFGHDWMTSVKSYHQTLQHLASWGIVVAAPATEMGFMPNHQGLAADLESCLQIVAGVKLGTGNVTVSPAKLGVAGHGMGAGAAILTAAGRDNIHAVGALYPAATAPSAVTAAAHTIAPGLIIGPGKATDFDSNESVKIAAQWAGPVTYREVSKGTQSGFSEGAVVKALVGMGRPQFSAQEKPGGCSRAFCSINLKGRKNTRRSPRRTFTPVACPPSPKQNCKRKSRIRPSPACRFNSPNRSPSRGLPQGWRLRCLVRGPRRHACSPLFPGEHAPTQLLRQA